MSTRLVRWKAVVPLGVFVALLALGWVLFADRIAKSAVESVGTAVIGAKVEVQRLHLSLAGGKVALQGLVVASPDEPLKNLFEADELVADLDVLPLLEKKVVIDRLAANGLKFGTPRATSGIVQSTGPTATQRVKESVTQWAQSLDVPALQLATGKIAIGQLDPGRLTTGREAQALAARADSAKTAWTAALGAIDVQATTDSAAAMVTRLRGAKPTDLAVLADARRTLTQVRQTRDRVVALERGVKDGLAGLQAGAAGLAAARQRDYALARGLLQIPSFDAPAIGAALFGRAAASRFERALYWTRLAREYMPPGLLPHGEPGPKRVRRAGTNVHFPRERALPGFLLRDAELSFLLEPTAAQPKRYAGRLTGLTSEPRLYGRPTTLSADAPGVRIGAMLDHVHAVPRDSGAAAVLGVALPALALPSLPLRLAPGRGTVLLSFALVGDTLHGRWGVQADAVQWVRDSAAPPGSNVQTLVERVVTGIRGLDVTASLGGTIDHPRLAVSSNLDQAVADRLRAVLAEDVAAAERQVRARVDSLVEPQAAAARQKVTALTSDVAERVSAQRARLDDAQRGLEQRLRQLTGGLLR